MWIKCNRKQFSTGGAILSFIAMLIISPTSHLPMPGAENYVALKRFSEREYQKELGLEVLQSDRQWEGNKVANLLSIAQTW